MTEESISTGLKRSRVAGAVLTALAGLAFLILPLGSGLTHVSYDYGFRWRPDIEVNDVVIVDMDEASETELGQGRWEGWDRKIHAEFLQSLARLTAPSRPRLVLFDIWFSDDNTNAAADQALVDAVRNFGPVAVIAKVTAVVHKGDHIGDTLSRPFDALAEVAAWGLPEGADENDFIREHMRNARAPSVAWSGATLVLGKEPGPAFQERWINYYGPPGQLTHVPYADVMSPGFNWASFSNKIVCVGARWDVGFTGGRGTDDYRTPYTRWTGAKSTGVEVVATCTRNMIHGDWMRRLPPWLECVVVLILGGILGWGLSCLSPMAAAGVAALAAFGVGASGMLLGGTTHFWFPWAVIVAVQVPLALGWAVLAHGIRISLDKVALEKAMSHLAASAVRGETSGDDRAVTEPTLKAHPAAAGTPATGSAALPSVPDHALLQQVGGGAYGEVWLARDIIGNFRAVKLVYRSRFENEAPYEREFNGLKLFTPLSGRHPALVNILHVGRHSNDDYIYYIMEIGDDKVAGQAIRPGSYSPRTLASDLKQRKRLPLTECLQLGIRLANAIEFVHQQELIHRDIKPGNVIYVRGEPKLADIGLVTGVVAEGGDVSFLGTKGYIPPEGPGRPAADIYSLGKLLYVSGMGVAPEMFPVLSDTLFGGEGEEEIFSLNAIILKACDPEAEKRWRSAGELEQAMTELLHRIESGNQAAE